MEVVGEIAADNSMSLERFKIPSTPYDYVPSEVNAIKGETDFKSTENPGQMVSILIQAKVQPKRMQEVCSPCVTNWCQTGTYLRMKRGNVNVVLGNFNMQDRRTHKNSTAEELPLATYPRRECEVIWMMT